MEKLIESLRELSDREFQRRAWLASAGPVVSSFSEQVSQTFDDTGLSIALEAERRPAELGADGFAALFDLDRAVARVDASAPPERLLEDPAVEEVRRLAARALELLERSESQ